MKSVLTFLMLLASLTGAMAQQQTKPEPVFTARFEVTAGAFDSKFSPRPRRALFLRWAQNDLQGERINGGEKQTIGLGTFAGQRLLARLEKLNLPAMDYQKYFDELARRPREEGKGGVITFDGQEVEVEIKLNATTVHFKMWNPDTFFYNHEDDEIAARVNAAVEAIVIALGKSSVYW